MNNPELTPSQYERYEQLCIALRFVSRVFNHTRLEKAVAPVGTHHD